MNKVVVWLLLLVPNVLVDVAALLLAPLIALLDERTANDLFSWFLTPDNPMTGDAGHEWRWLGKSEYVQKVAWLCRNRAYGFSSTVLRARSNGPVTVRGNPLVSNRPFVPGLVIRTTPEGYWQFYFVRRTFEGRCLRVNLGWKLWGTPGDGPLFGQYVFSANPFMGLSE